MQDERKNKNHWILGGGVSGLVLQFYNPEFTIITPEIGGMYSNSYIVWLHSTVETQQLLRDLGYENVDKLHKKSYMGYYHDGWIHEKLSPELNLLLIQKKMSNWDQPVDTTFIPKSHEMSTRSANQVNYMDVLNVEPAEIVKKLEERKGTVIRGLVTKITDSELTYKNGDIETTIQYDKIISTIAAPFFWKAYGQERTFRQEPITNVITNVKPDVFDDRFEMVYYTDQLFTRISHLQGKYGIEFTGIITKEQFEVLYPKCPIEKIIVIPHGRIFQEENNPPNPNITFAGRFGCWKFGITLEMVIQQAIEYKQIKQYYANK